MFHLEELYIDAENSLGLLFTTSLDISQLNTEEELTIRTTIESGQCGLHASDTIGTKIIVVNENLERNPIQTAKLSKKSIMYFSRKRHRSR